MKKKMSGDNVKVVQEVNRRKIEMIVYAAFWTGFIANSEQRTALHPDNIKEIKNLVELISKESL